MDSLCKSDPASYLSIVLGSLGLVMILFGCCTMGVTYYLAVPVSLLGLAFGFQGKGAGKIVPLALNAFVLFVSISVSISLLSGGPDRIHFRPPESCPWSIECDLRDPASHANDNLLPDFALSADAFFDSYLYDMRSANRQYRGKFIQLIGEVDHVSGLVKTLDGRPVHIGDTVMVRGRCDGKNDPLTNVVLIDCVLFKMKPGGREFAAPSEK